MTRRRKLFLSCIALAAMFVGALFWRNREPSYQGRTLSAWADIGLKATDATPWDMPNVLLASNAIRQIGTNGFDWLRESIPWKDSSDISLMVWLLDKNSTLEEAVGASLVKPLFRRAERSAFALHSLGETALPLVSDLSTNTVISPDYFITSIGLGSVPALIPMLTNSPPDARTHLALHFVRDWGTNAFTAGPCLWSGMESIRNTVNEGNWLSALASTGYRSEELSKMLVARIRSDAKPPDYAKQLIWALARIPGWGTRALVSLIDHPEPEVQQRALLSLLGKYSGNSPPVRQPVFRLNSDYGGLGSVPMLLNQSSSNALREASVSIRLRAVQLAMQGNAGSSSNGWYLRSSETRAFISGFTNDPEREVLREAAKALEEFRFLEKP